MTPDELEAIRERDVDCVPAGYTSAQAARDRRALLAEVDRLAAAGFVQATLNEGAMRERARILAAVEGLHMSREDWDYNEAWNDCLKAVGAAIKGEA
jgi:hypothetical protein